MGEKYSREEFAARLGAAERGDPKLNAAADFAARLLNSPIGDRVARIVLFGSVARGEAKPDSDVDVMVFAHAPANALSRAAGEASYETTVACGELVAPLTYPASRLFWPLPYVVYTTLKRGLEVYAMNETEVRQREALALYAKSELHLIQAQTALAANSYELAIVGAYTSAELAVKALLMLKPGIEMPTSHGGVVQIFSREYVKTGEAPAFLASVLNSKLETQSRALYDLWVKFEEKDSRDVLELAQTMLDLLKRKLDEAGVKP